MLIDALKKLQSYGLEPNNILDIGSGSGENSLYLSKKLAL